MGRLFIYNYFCLPFIVILAINSSSFGDQTSCSSVGEDSLSPTMIKELGDALNRTTYGSKVLENLLYKNPYKEPITVCTLKKDIAFGGRTRMGTIKYDLQNGKWVLKVNSDLSPLEMAHVVAHEFNHLVIAAELQSYFENHKDAGNVIRKIKSSIESRSLFNFVEQNGCDKLLFYLKYRFYHEYKAYLANATFAQEGLWSNINFVTFKNLSITAWADAIDGTVDSSTLNSWRSPIYEKCSLNWNHLEWEKEVKNSQSSRDYINTQRNRYLLN